jgi:hypothetical protein
MENFSLLNDMDLSDYVAGIIYSDAKPAKERFTEKDANGNFMLGTGVVKQVREIMQNLNNRDFVSKNKNAIAQMLAYVYIKRNIRPHLINYKNADGFLTAVEFDNDLSDAVKNAMAVGNKIYKFNADKAPNALRGEIVRLNEFLQGRALAHLERGLADNAAVFKIETKYFEVMFDNIRSAIAASKWNGKTPKVSDIQMPGTENSL